MDGRQKTDGNDAGALESVRPLANLQLHVEQHRASTALGAATRMLSPVVLSFGADSPRFSSFCNSIEHDASGPALILRPIAARALPSILGANGLVLHSVQEKQNWSIRAHHIEAVSDDTARVSLSRLDFSLSTRRERSRAAASHNALTLVVPGKLDDSDIHVFPVVDAGANHCTVDVCDPLEPGQTFPVVEIHSARRVLRRAQASVIDAIPWYQPDGSKRFRCRLVFRASPQSEHADRLYDLITDAGRIEQLLHAASLLRAGCWYEGANAQRGKLVLAGVDAAEATLTWQTGAPLEHATKLLRVGFELFTTGYELEVRPLHIDQGVVTTSLPLILRRRQWRREQRVYVPPERNLKLEFTSPTAGRRQRRTLRDLSFRGACFESRISDDVLWPSLPLEDAHVVGWGRRIKLGDVEVRSIESRDGAVLCHTAMRAASLVDDNRFIDLIASLRHPDLQVEDGSHFQTILELHESAGLVRPFMRRNLECVTSQAMETWRRMHQNAPDVCRTLIHQEDDKVVACVSSIRAYERSWTAQHMSASPTRQWRSPAILDIAYTEHIVPRSDAYFTAMWVARGNGRQTNFLGRFLELTGTGEAGSRNRLLYFIQRPGSQRSRFKLDDDVRVRPMTAEDETLVANASARMLGTIGAESLSLVKGEFDLPDTTKRFARAGVLRTRRCSIVERRGVPAIAILEELADPGINLGWLLNAAWFIPLHDAVDADSAATRSALAYIETQPAPLGSGDRFLFVGESTDVNALNEFGYALEIEFDLYAYNRAGLHRWYDYVHETRGEMFLKNLRKRRLAESTDGKSHQDE